jgi:hypothetical protein
LHRDEVIRQADRRLVRLRYEEQLRVGPVTPLELEHELTRVWEHIRPKARSGVISPFGRAATRIARPFNPAQLAAVAALLVEMLEHVPWRFDTMAWWKAVGRIAASE